MSEPAREWPVWWPVGPQLSVSEAGKLGDALSAGDGESQGIYPLTQHPGWLAKIYKKPQSPNEIARLDWLISVPDRASSGDRELLRRNTCWPVARLTDDFGRGVGCVLPVAPEKYRGRIGAAEPRYLEVDLLAKPDDFLRRRRMQVPSWYDRVRVCECITAIGSVLERHSLVYSDWSYSNAFWCPADNSVYLIDVDGVAYRAKPNLSQPNWDDPLTSGPAPADMYTDRYRIALLVARCLTGERDHDRAVHGVARTAGGGVTDLLLDVLLAVERVRRPPVSALHAALTGLPYVRVPLHRRPMPPPPSSAPRRQHPGPRYQPPVSPVARPPAPVPAPVAKGLPAGQVVLMIVMALVVFVICMALVLP